MKKLMLVANPFSGRGQAKLNLMDIVREFNAADYAVSVYTPDKDAGRSVSDLVRSFAPDHDLVVCMGGDGTLSDTIAGLVAGGSSVPLGYIPLGSTNDMANSLGLPKTPLAAARTIIGGAPVPYDVGYYDGRYFSYVAAFGAFTDVSYMTPQNLKNTFGHAAYIFSGLSKLQEINPIRTTVEYDEGVIEDSFLFGGVLNSTSMGGVLKLDQTKVSLNDGLFEVLLIRNPVNAAELGNILSDLLTQTYVSENVILLHTKKVRFHFHYPTSLTRDGESGGLYADVTMENLHNAVRIMRDSVEFASWR
ncbi:MAG: diacylglycerol kinase family lipid kinase [Oscillospiraceae bacterium]|nr:diacylglycerol kinase family lipid kinase [Oscillospiraceae bacterium]